MDYNYTSLSETPHHVMHRPQTFDPPWIDFFTSRPCPYHLKRSPGFLLFALLPMELQLMIWHFAIPEGKILKISTVLDDEGEECEYITNSAIPAVLHACRNSRNIALRYLTPAFGVQLPNPVYFNFARDTLHLADQCAYSLILDINFSSDELKIKMMEELRSLKLLAIPELCMGAERYYVPTYFYHIMMELSGLEFIFLVRTPQNFVGARPKVGRFGLPKTNAVVTVLPKDPLPARWRQMVFESMAGRILDTRDWERPCIFVMHHWQVRDALNNRIEFRDDALKMREDIQGQYD